MPTITLRISDAEHDTLREMAKWKEVSLSDLIREYSRAGIRADAANTSIREAIEKTIQQEKERLERVGELLEQVARGDAPVDAQASNATEGPRGGTSGSRRRNTASADSAASPRRAG